MDAPSFRDISFYFFHSLTRDLISRRPPKYSHISYHVKLPLCNRFYSTPNKSRKSNWIIKLQSICHSSIARKSINLRFLLSKFSPIVAPSAGSFTLRETTTFFNNYQFDTSAQKCLISLSIISHVLCFFYIQFISEAESQLTSECKHNAAQTQFWFLQQKTMEKSFHVCERS